MNGTQTHHERLGTFDRTSLGKEAEFLHRQFFGGEISNSLRQKFIDAHTHCDLTPLPLHEAMDRIVRHNLDAEAIEYATRKLNTALTRKIHILFYLAEAHSDYYPLFVNEKDDSARAFLAMIFTAAVSACKWLKGHYLTWRYDLV